MAMHYRRHPPNPSTNPFTGRGLPTASPSPYRQTNDHDHSKPPSSVNMMAKKATLIVLSFVVFFYLFSSGGEPEVAYGNHGKFQRKDANQNGTPVKLTVPEVANVKITSNEYLHKYGSGQRDEVGQDQFDKREDSRDQYSYKSKGASNDAYDNNEYKYENRKESAGEYHYDNEENASQDFDRQDSSFGVQHPDNTASDVEHDADNFDYTADRGDSHDFSVEKSDVSADAFDYRAKERLGSYDTDRTGGANKDPENRFEPVAKNHDPESLSLAGRMDGSDLVYKTADEDESSDNAAYAKKHDDGDEPLGSKDGKATDEDESNDKSNVDVKRRDDGDEMSSSVRRESKYGKVTDEDGSSDGQNVHGKSYNDAEERYDSESKYGSKVGVSLDGSEDGNAAQSLEVPMSHGEDESDKRASHHSSYGRDDSERDRSRGDGGKTVDDASEKTGQYSSQRHGDTDAVRSAGNSEDGLKWKQLDSKYRRSYGESDATNNNGKDSESFNRHDSYEKDESVKKENSNSATGRLTDSVYASAVENEYHKKTSSVLDGSRSDEETADGYEFKTVKETPTRDRSDASIESDKYSKLKQEAAGEDQSLGNSRDGLKWKNLDAKYPRSAGDGEAGGDGYRSSPYEIKHDSSNHVQTLGSNHRRSEGEGEAISGDYKSKVTEDTGNDSTSYEKSKYTKYISDEEGGSTNDGNISSAVKDTEHDSTGYDKKSEGYEDLKSSKESEASGGSYKASLTKDDEHDYKEYDKKSEGFKYDRSAGGGEAEAVSVEHDRTKGNEYENTTLSNGKESSATKDEGRVSTNYDKSEGSKYPKSSKNGDESSVTNDGDRLSKKYDKSERGDRTSNYSMHKQDNAEDAGSSKTESYLKSSGHREKDGDSYSGSKVEESARTGETAEDGSDKEPSDYVKSFAHSDSERTKSEKVEGETASRPNSVDGESISSAQDKSVHKKAGAKDKSSDAEDSDRASKKSFKVKDSKEDSARSKKPRDILDADKSGVDYELSSVEGVSKKIRLGEETETATDSHDVSVKESGDDERTSSHFGEGEADSELKPDRDDSSKVISSEHEDSGHEKSDISVEEDEAAETEKGSSKAGDLFLSEEQKSRQNTATDEKSLPGGDEENEASGKHDETAVQDAVDSAFSDQDEELKAETSSGGKGYIRGSASKEGVQSEFLKSVDDSVEQLSNGLAGLRGSKKSVTNDMVLNESNSTKTAMDSEDTNGSMDGKAKRIDSVLAVVDESDGEMLLEKRKARETDSNNIIKKKETLESKQSHDSTNPSDGQKVDVMKDETKTKILAGSEDAEVKGSADELKDSLFVKDPVEDDEADASDHAEGKADATEESEVESARESEAPEVPSGDESKNDPLISSAKTDAMAVDLLESEVVSSRKDHNAVDQSASSDALLDGAELTPEKEID